MGNDREELFNFYRGNCKNANPQRFPKENRRSIFSALVSNLKQSKGEKSSLGVACKTWIKCIGSSISKYSEFVLYNIEANIDTFDEDVPVSPTLLSSWFYSNKDERLNKLSGNKSLLKGKDYIKNDEKGDYFSDTISLGKKYYVLKKLGNVKERNKKFIVNLLWWIGKDVLKLDEEFLLKKIYVFLSDSESISEENINSNDLNKKLGRYFPEEIKRFQIKTCCFDEVINEISNSLSLPKETFQFKADCHSYYYINENRVCYELSNNQTNSLETVSGKIYAVDSENRYKPEDFVSKCVEVTGTLGFDKITARFQLNVKTIKIIQDDTSLEKERKNWREEYAAILKKGAFSSITKLPTIRPEKKIIVISQKESKGYADFKKKLSLDDSKSKNKLIDMTELKPVTRFTAGRISVALKEAINENDNYQCICIVRGGGDKQQLHEFSKPVLLEAIHAATEVGIPVITAIGHTNDIPLCYYVDGVYGADTPTDAGISIKKQFQKYCKENKTPRKKQK